MRSPPPENKINSPVIPQQFLGTVRLIEIPLERFRSHLEESGPISNSFGVELAISLR